MSAHSKGYGREIRKSGMTVNIRTPHNLTPEQKYDFQAREIEYAIKALKKKMMSEGMIKDIKRQEYHKTRGQIKREKRKVAVRKQRAMDAKKEY